MSSLILWIFLIAIWHSILFYEKAFGISVILFIIPLLTFIYYVLEKNNKIKNKKGLLWMIPILLLSLTYTIFNNWFFNTLNILVITLLFTLMYIYTIKPTFNLEEILNEIIILLIEPLTKVSQIYNLTVKKWFHSPKEKKPDKGIIKSILIILPITLIIIILLSSADSMFANLFTFFTDFLEKLSIPGVLKDALFRCIPLLLIFFYLAGTINFILYNYEKTKVISSKNKINIETKTIKLLLMVLNGIYVIFDIIQIRSLFLHKVSMDITYAEYARQGFFQLMIVSIINVIIILVSKSTESKNTQKEENQWINGMCILMIALTFIIIISSFIRMYMYESEYGYTLLRLLVYVTLITETILLIPTIFYIYNTKVNIVKAYMIIIVSVYTLINFANVDYLIAKNNIDRYYKTEKIDLDYLENYGTDNIPLLLELYQNTEEESVKDSLELYFKYLEIDRNSFQEFNLSKYQAQKQIESANIPYPTREEH